MYFLLFRHLYKKIIMKLKIYAIIILLFTACTSQKSSMTTAIADMVEEQAYVFKAQSVFPTEDARYNPRLMFPTGNNLYHLSSGYDLKLTPDSVVAYLPYFGRSFTAPVNPSEGGIKFISTDFSYKKNIRKGNYEIEIVPADNREVRNLYLTISPNGYSSLRILMQNKTPISFNGVVEANR